MRRYLLSDGAVCLFVPVVPGCTRAFLLRLSSGMAVALRPLVFCSLSTCPQEYKLMRLLSPRSSRVLSYLFMTTALIVLSLMPVMAQDHDLTPPKAEIKLTVGASGFTSDQGRIPHGLAGASVRIYVNRRFSVEPEFLYMRNSPDDQDYLAQQSFAYDLAEPSARFVPYVIAGVGVLHHRGRFFGLDFDTRQPRVFDESYTAFAASAGAGVKIFLTKRLFIAPEGRVGRQPSLRGTVSIGYVFSGKN